MSDEFAITHHDTVVPVISGACGGFMHVDRRVAKQTVVDGNAVALVIGNDLVVDRMVELLERHGLTDPVEVPS